MCIVGTYFARVEKNANVYIYIVSTSTDCSIKHDTAPHVKTLFYVFQRLLGQKYNN
jgi:riboflavin synthase